MKANRYTMVDDKRQVSFAGSHGAWFHLIIILVMLLGCLGFNSFAVSAKPAPQMNLQELAKELADGRSYKRIIVLQTMARKYPEKATEFIVEAMLHDTAKHVRRAAQRALIGNDDPMIMAALQQGIGHDKRTVRLAAVDALAAVKDAWAFNMLVAALKQNPQDDKLVLLALESMRTVAYHTEPDPGVEQQVMPWLNRGNKKIKITTIIVLSLLGRPAALPALIQQWPTSSTKVKIYLCDAFANIGYVDPLPLLTEALQDGNKLLVMHALYALAQIQSTQSLPAIYRLLEKSKAPRVVMASLYALTEIGDEASVPAIMAKMKSDDPTILHWAAYALGQLKAKTASHVLLDKLQHEHSLVRATAAMALGEIKAMAAESALLKILKTSQEAEEVKVAAAKALTALGSKKGRDYFWEALQNPRLDTSVHLTYAMALAQTGAGPYREKLISGLANDDFNNRFVYAVAAGSMGINQARPILVNALEHGYRLIRRYAVIGLESIADEEAVRALADTANDDQDEIVRILCAASLVGLGYPDYEIVLWNALDDKNEDVRSEALIALGTYLDNTMVEKLKWYLKREPAIPVRQTIHRLLRQWQAR